MTELRIGVTGAAGRMGTTLVRQVRATDGCAIAGAIERPGHDAVGRDAGEVAGLDALGVPIGDDPVE
ncbi:MAG: 4-hydroxy-tetrahydrodipicolinate reductase, partial [Alphaproteobacteria bacterium]